MRIEFRDEKNTKILAFTARTGKVAHRTPQHVIVQMPVARLDAMLDELAHERDARYVAPFAANDKDLAQLRQTVAALQGQAGGMQREVETLTADKKSAEQRAHRAEAQVIKMQNWIDQILELKADRYGD